MNDIEKQFLYNRVKVNETDNLRWVKNVITDVFFTEPSILTWTEYQALLVSLKNE